KCLIGKIYRYLLPQGQCNVQYGWISPSMFALKGYKMHEKYRYGLWGAAAGAIALTVVGFTWGGWSTSGGTAKQVEAAVLTALIPGCAKDVMADPAAVAELKVK